jgi:hypothetical protein
VVTACAPGEQADRIREIASRAVQIDFFKVTISPPGFQSPKYNLE